MHAVSRCGLPTISTPFGNVSGVPVGRSRELPKPGAEDLTMSGTGAEWMQPETTAAMIHSWNERRIRLF
nr:hypothetical protein [uncultured Dyadobacter sp.]